MSINLKKSYLWETLPFNMVELNVRQFYIDKNFKQTFNLMIRLISIFIFFVSILALLSFRDLPLSSEVVNPNNDSLNAAKQKFVDEILQAINGKEKMQSDSVFKNVQMLKQMPAERLLGLMNNGFSKALGVGCDHCHNTNDFASEEIPAKQIAREMMNMSGKIREMLSEIKEIKTEDAHVNCTTCHRGSIVPATKME